MPKLTINGAEIEVAQGTSILQAAEMLGIEIPRFCYHDRLSVPANCRMCLVEVKGAPKPVASCAMAAGDNMEVFTKGAMVDKARRGVMEFLLINHPLDCPICDQGGECDLQDQAVSYGFDRSRYNEDKRSVKDKDFGPLIKTAMTRCIQCTRCIRFGQEVAGVPTLGLLNRGEDVEVGTFVGKAIESELSGNMIDICPVGALLSKPYSFQARPWELTKTETIDVHDAVGSNIRVDARGNEVLRVLPRLHEGVNEEWISDKTRFAYDGLKKSRLDRPMVRSAETGKRVACSWEEALQYAASAMGAIHPHDRLALAGDLADVESVVALKDLWLGGSSSNFDCRINGEQFDPTVRAGYIFNTTIQGLEDADLVLLLGVNPRHEASLINARIRKTWVDKAIPVGLIGEDADLTYPHEHLGTSLEDFAALASGKGEFAQRLAAAERPVLIVGMSAFRREDGLAVHAGLHKEAEKLGFVKKGWNGFNVLHQAASMVGALDVGFVSEKPVNIAAAKLVYLLGVDSEHVIDQIAPDAFVIYQGHHGDLGAQRADLILPGAAYTEKDAVYVNTEGRPQLAKRAVFPVGEAREDWKVLRALSGAVGRPLSYDTLAQLRSRIAGEWPHLAEIDQIAPAKWQKFGATGKVDGAAELSATVTSFYSTNVITRASDIMASCIARFENGNTTEKMAAE